MECSVDTVKTNEDQNVMARHLCGNFWWELQTETIIPSLHKLFGLFSISYTGVIAIKNIGIFVYNPPNGWCTTSVHQWFTHSFSMVGCKYSNT